MGRNPTHGRKARRVTFHFAYGSNMNRAVMRRHAPGAEPIGVASLANYRFLITTHGHASIAPLRTSTVYGVLWRLTPRDRVTLAAWENISGGLYRSAILPVRERPPSQYIVIAPPLSMIDSAVMNISSSRAPRRTGNAPPRL